MSKRRKFTGYEKKKIYSIHRGRCAICGEIVSEKKMCISHKTPLSKGGTNAMDNLLLTCWSCSQAKQNLDMDGFLKMITKIFLHNKEQIE